MFAVLYKFLLSKGLKNSSRKGEGPQSADEEYEDRVFIIMKGHALTIVRSVRLPSV